MPSKPTLFAHQAYTRDFIIDKQRVLVFSDPGTGKTASVLAAIEHHQKNGGGRALVLAPKAILEPAWVADCRKFTPSLSIGAAYATNRSDAFKLGTKVVVTNHDAARWLLENKALLQGFDFLVIDESTAFKNKDSKRSKAIASLTKQFTHRVIMTGTPMPNGLIDIWHQAFIVDDGERLGSRYYAFRATTHEPVAVGFDIMQWAEKEGARDAVADLLSDITVRFKFEDCTDIPANSVHTMSFELSRKVRNAYDIMVEESIVALEKGEVQALNAASLAGKLLQIASGAVYDADGTVHVIDSTRYELIAELVAQRTHSLVAFQWRHQRDELIKALNQQNINDIAIVDGEHNTNTATLVEDFQSGKYRVLLAHPQSAGHGLTLTKATTTIWASPTWNAEHFEQFNRRIYRTGQTQKTETILIEAAETLDNRVYTALQSKIDKQLDLLQLLKSLATPDLIS
jgi:SNF2 family DNA or RNA helicase